MAQLTPVVGVGWSRGGAMVFAYGGGGGQNCQNISLRATRCIADSKEILLENMYSYTS